MSEINAPTDCTSQIEREAGITIVQAPIDLCQREYSNCWDAGCVTDVTMTYNPVLVNTNATSFVGVHAIFQQKCVCGPTDFTADIPKCGAYSCLNGGSCQENWNGYT